MPIFIPFIVGGAIGAAAALMLAPHSGEQMRAMVSEKANAVMSEAKEWSGGAVDVEGVYKTAQEKGASVFQDVAAKGQEFAKNAQAQTTEFVNAAAATIKNATGQAEPAEAEPAGDDLREKIEAARQRIAAQVVANAEQAANAAPVEAAAEAVEEVAAEVADAAEEVVEAVEEAVEDAAEEVEKAAE